MWNLLRLFRRRPLTPEEVAARNEAKALRAQMVDDRISQDSKSGMIYRSGRR
jgi:hypothetical protein